jgi:hypothetical protein
LNLRLRNTPGMAGRGSLTEPQGSMRQLALNDPRANDALSPAEKTARAIAEAEKMDCLQLSQAGLLAIPVGVLMALMDKCKPQR